ncbi:hypothetical protein R84981_002821 [Carnimonas sp. R-84981]|uniref:phage tail assembly chaperone n=1 Tax=Carnimonas bestiolae TaxID=3402172 RepID=UPI003EDBBB32
MIEETISGHNYRINKMGAYEQLETMALLAPVIEAMSKKTANPILGAIEELGRLPRETRNTLFNLALQPVHRQNGKNWTPFISFDEASIAERPAINFDDIAGNELGQLVYKSVEHSLSNFLPESLTGETPSPEKDPS